ncbi:MAG: type II secretion system protein GspM [Panacagrimonas sp.]
MNPALTRTFKPLTDATGQARERFLALQPRERWMLGVGGVVLFVTLLYLAVWEPIVGAHANRTAALESSRALAIKLEQAAAQVQQSRGRSPGATAGRGTSLMAAVDLASKQSGLGKGPSRIQPEGDREVRVWFEDVSFDLLARWLADLQTRYGINVQTFDVEPQSAPGRVNVRLSLVRPS